MQLFAAKCVQPPLGVVYHTLSYYTPYTDTCLPHTLLLGYYIHTIHWCPPQNHTTDGWIWAVAVPGLLQPGGLHKPRMEGGGGPKTAATTTGIPEVTRCYSMLLFIVTQTSRGKTRPVYLYTPIDRFEVLYVEDTVSKCRSIGNPIIWDLENHPL